MGDTKAYCVEKCSIFVRRKNMDEARSLETPLSRCLTVYHLIFYGIAHMAGAGIYVLAGTIVRDNCGPAATLSFFMCGISAFFTGFCYVEFATLIPRTGSCYTFTYVTLGELPAFIVGWTMLSDLIISLAAVAKGFSSTLDTITNGAITNYTINHVGRLADSPVLDKTWDFVGFGLIVLLILLTVTGANISLSLNIGLSVLQIMCLTLITIGCFIYGSLDNWSPAKGGFFPYGFEGVILGASVAVFAYSGFEAITSTAEESINPRKDLPIALISALSIIMVLYCMASLGISYLVNYKEIFPGSPFVAGFISVNQRWMEVIAAIGTLLATGATKLAAMYVLPRMFYAIAADGLIFKFFAWVEPRTQVPLAGLFVGGIIAAILTLFLNIQSLAEFVSMGILLSYLFIGIDLLYLRYLFFHETGAYKSLRILEDDETEETERNVPAVREWASFLVKRYPKLQTFTSLKIIISSFVVSSFVLGLIVKFLVPFLKWWSWMFLGFGFLGLFVTFFMVTIYKPDNLVDMYKAPLNPLAPCMTIAVNGVLIMCIQPLTWLRCAVWTFLGLTIYFFYGIRHSHAKSLSQSDYVNLDEITPSINMDSTENAGLIKEKKSIGNEVTESANI